jgi:nucleotide-binding universal stress UspA family protein
MTSRVLHEHGEPQVTAIRGSIVVGVGPLGRDINRALWEAALWAARRGADLSLMSAVGDRRHRTGSAASSEGSQRRRRALFAVNGVAHRLARSTDVNQVVHTQVVDEPAEQMLIEASTVADLIVLQRRELRAAARLRIGSTTAAVAAHAACPALIVHADDQISVGRAVLAVVDDRRSAGTCLAEAFDEARHRGAELIAVACQGRLCDSTSLAHSVSRTAHAASAADLAEQLSGRQQEYPEVLVRQVTLDGPPIDGLLALARDSGLVVVGRHRRGQPGIRNLSTLTRELIEEARCPVLVVPPS